MKVYFVTTVSYFYLETFSAFRSTSHGLKLDLVWPNMNLEHLTCADLDVDKNQYFKLNNFTKISLEKMYREEGS